MPVHDAPRPEISVVAFKAKDNLTLVPKRPATLWDKLLRKKMLVPVAEVMQYAVEFSASCINFGFLASTLDEYIALKHQHQWEHSPELHISLVPDEELHSWMKRHNAIYVYQVNEDSRPILNTIISLQGNPEEN